LKPINLAVGRAIWNRFGDIRTFAVNIHLKFPFAAVGGVLVIPTYEETGSKAAKEAEKEEIAEEEDIDPSEVSDAESSPPASAASTASPSAPAVGRKQTIHLIERAIERLMRAGGRKSEAESAHLLEAIAIVVYDPDTATLRTDIPAIGSGLRWDEFIAAMVAAYRARFED
jgi:hypothetical protein